MALSRRRQALIAALIATAGIASITSAALLRDGDGGPPLDSRVEELIPEPDSEVLAQQAFGLDLTDDPRYVIELYLNGQRMPDDETAAGDIHEPVLVSARPGGAPSRSCAPGRTAPGRSSTRWPKDPPRPRRGEVRWCFGAA